MWTAFVLSLVAAAPERFVFGIPGEDWVIVDSDGGLVRRFTQVDGLKPTDLALSPDGTRLAVIVRPDGDRPHLYLVAEKRKTREVALRGDVADAPIFSSDGRFVFLSANNEVPHNSKLPMRYAQVWRVDFDSAAATQLTTSNGCHMWPQLLRPDELLISHSSCEGDRTLEILNVSKRSERAVLPTTRLVGEASAAPDGRRAVFTQAGRGGTEFIELTFAGMKQRQLGVTRIEGGRIRPHWASDGASILYQSEWAVWRMGADGQTTQLHSLRTNPVGAQQ